MCQEKNIVISWGQSTEALSSSASWAELQEYLRPGILIVFSLGKEREGQLVVQSCQEGPPSVILQGVSRTCFPTEDIQKGVNTAWQVHGITESRFLLLTAV